MFLSNRHFPVPLVDVSTVVMIEEIIFADRSHISANAFAGNAVKLMERHAFPFCGGLDDLSADRRVQSQSAVEFYRCS